ncbi:putative inhibitor of apoptosis [Arctopsyche grandis]|uniref:putative inhibitor of apoptosis n=1 Tax=Arctopsyche grandis TaxID=121162 RepID=UPI00406DA3F8
MQDNPFNIVTVSDDIEETLHHIYRSDSLRLLSFVNWPHHDVSRESLALAGFYFVTEVNGDSTDKVRCAWCSVEIENWAAGHCPITEHLRYFPTCQYAIDVAEKYRSRITESQFANNDLLRHTNISELGIQSHRPPVQPKYSTFKSRLDTYGPWPASHPQTPESLATAGFYYSGLNDQVRCFHCDVVLCYWEPTDDPWTEHAKWLPECGFLNLIKTRDFIDQCVNSRTETQIVERRVGNSSVRNVRPPVVTEADVEQFMGSPCAMVALNCGLQPDRIRRAIRIKLRRTGIPFNSASNLIDAALNEQVNETPFGMPALRSYSWCASSSSSSHYPVDDAAIDEVTRMIINSALTDDSLEAPRPPPPTSINIWDTGMRNRHVRDEFAETRENIEVINESNDESDDVEEPDLIPENVIIKNESEADVNLIISPEDLQKAALSESGVISLAQENKLLRDARTCKICLDSEVSVVFLPCGHLVSCIACATGLLQCPICRGNIKGIVRTYLS